MLTIVSRKYNFKKKQVLFANKPKSPHIIGLYDYYQCQSIKSFLGFIKRDKYTTLIDPTKSPEEILSRCNKTTQYQIKRSIKEGAKFSIETDINTFTDFYNEFASSNNLALLESSYLDSFRNNLFISKGSYKDDCLVMHASIIDQDLKRVHMLGSASRFRTVSDIKKRALVGRVNRFLHFKDMIYAKNKNMLVYDFGGYAQNTEDKTLQGINKFKDGFRGKLKKENNYTSYPLWLLRELKRFMNL